MNVSRKLLLTALFVVCATGVGVVGASAALSGGAAGPHVHAEHTHGEGGDKFKVARDHGVDPASAKKVLEDNHGRSYSVARAGDTACLMDTQAVYSCNSEAEIAAGRGIQVQADCSTNGVGPRMTLVRGLVPREVADLRVGYSDGSLKRAKVADGAVLLEVPTPGADDPYPTSLTWSDSGGGVLRSAAFPFDGRKLCLPVPDQP
jgi:hypothetical protein